MNLLIYTPSFLPTISDITNKIKILLDMDMKYNKFNKIIILTPDEKAIKTYRKYAVLKLPYLNLLDTLKNVDFYYTNYSFKIRDALEYLIVKDNISHIHLFQSDFINYYFVQIANKYNLRILYSWHIDIFKKIEINNKKKYPIMNLLYYNFNCLKKIDIYTISNSSKIFLEKKLKKNVNVLPFVVDTKLFYPIKKNINKKFTVLYIGEIEFDKNIFELLQLQILFKFRLILIGDGSQIYKIKKDYNENDIIFINNISNDDLYKYYNYADLYINPSKTDTLSNNILEAMACKLLVLGRNENGIKDIITHNDNGLLYNNFEELKFYFKKIY